MKKLFTLFLCLSAFTITFAQSRIAVKGQPQIKKQLSTVDHSRVLQSDTATNPNFFDDCAITSTFYPINDTWGFIGGTNGYLDLEKAQLINHGNADGFVVTEIQLFFHSASVVDDGSMRVKIYSVNADGGPGNLVSVSNPVKVSEVALENQAFVPTIFTFSEEITVPGASFYVSLDVSELYATMDTVGIYSSQDSCGDGSTAWELFSDGISWFAVNDNDFSWGLNFEFQVVAIGDAASGMSGSGELIGDTILYLAASDPCDSLAFTRPTNGWGYIGGTNEFADLEKAQKITTPESGYWVSQAVGFFTTPGIIGDGELTAKIYEVDDDGSPGAVMGESNPINISQVTPPNGAVMPTYLTFDPPVYSAGDEFYVSIYFGDLYASQDTLGIFLTGLDCGTPGDSYEMFANGNWVPIDDIDSSWGINSDFLLGVMVEKEEGDPSSIYNFDNQNSELTLLSLYPNPANQQINLGFEIGVSTDLKLEIYTMHGALLHRQMIKNINNGSYTYPVDVSQFDNGYYFVHLTGKKARSVAKFVIAR